MVLDLAGIESWLAETGALDIADEIGRLETTERLVVYRLLDRDRALAVFETLDPHHQQEILDGLRGERMHELLESLDPDDRARLVNELPAKVAKRVLAGLSPAERSYTAALLGYPDESAGRIMTPEFVSLRASMTAADALAKIRRTLVEEETLYSLPVTDDERHLIGSVDLPTLVRAPVDSRVVDLLAPEVHSIPAVEDQEVSARLIRDANLAALPVVDSEERLVGMITFDDAMRILQLEETEDHSRAGGSEPLGRPYLSVSMAHLAAKRAVWLLILVAGATLTVNVLAAFEATLQQRLTLALFVPLLIGTRRQHRGSGDIRRHSGTGGGGGALLRPAAGGAEGGAHGSHAGRHAGNDRPRSGDDLLRLSVRDGRERDSSGDLHWATFAGSMIPMLADRAGIDPTVVSAPFITTLVDATGLIIYFMVARMILGLQ